MKQEACGKIRLADLISFTFNDLYKSLYEKKGRVQRSVSHSVLSLLDFWERGSACGDLPSRLNPFLIDIAYCLPGLCLDLIQCC